VNLTVGTIREGTLGLNHESRFNSLRKNELIKSIVGIIEHNHHDSRGQFD